MSWLSIPSPEKSVPRWHITPAIDLAAYAFSWVWVTIPLAILGDARPEYFVWYVLVIIVTDVHRHYGLPYVYLDSQVRKRFPLRFTIFPLLMFAMWLGAPFYRRGGDGVTVVGAAALAAWLVVLIQLMRQDPGDKTPRFGQLGIAVGVGVSAGALADFVLSGSGDGSWGWLGGALVSSVLLTRAANGKAKIPIPGLLIATGFGTLLALDAEILTTRFRARDVINIVAVVAATWNIWHVYMQKYGILRMYNAKSGNETKVPGWVDRLLVFGWLPFYFVWLGPTYRKVVFQAFSRGRKTLTPIIDAMEFIQPYLLVPTIGLIVASVGIFLWWEWKANRLRNRPRLLMALGTTALSSLFVLIHPIKAYLAFAFSHAVEYMVFVWAFQRRRYHHRLAHNPTLGRALKYPWLAYGGFILGLAALFVVLKYWGRTVFPGQPRPFFLGLPTTEWIAYWTIFQSMVHFYFDGFLWKMRLPATRAHI